MNVVLRKRNLHISLLLTLVMVVGLFAVLPVPASAASDAGSYIFDITEGNITVSAGSGAGKIKVTYGSGDPQTTTAEFANTQEITIIGNSTSTSNTITVTGCTAAITLSGVNISGGTPFSITSSGTVNLTLVGGNTLTASYSNAGLYVPYNSTLHILSISAGSLNAHGSGYGAGIGGQGSSTDTAGNGIITISGGTVTASGGEYTGAGIGCSEYCNGNSITIDGGTVIANGGRYSAGIGGGWGSSGSIAQYNITISGSANVEANAANESYSSAIGSGRGPYYENNGTITIEGTPTVTANGDGDGAAIGGGEQTSGGTINISGGTVTAYGDIQGGNGAGIGGGSSGNGGTITISGGTIKTHGSYNAAGIGGGNGGSGGSITISGGSVTVDDMRLSGSGIGGGNGGAAGIITISGGFVTAGSELAAGIGCGLYGSGGSVTIEAGSVKASSFSPAPTNNDTTPIYMATITGLPANKLLNYEIDNISGDSADASKTFSGTYSCISDGSGKAYLWLPLSSDRYTTVVAKDTSVSEDGSDNAFYAASGYVTTGTNNFTESTKSPSYIRATASALPDSYIMNINKTNTFYAVAENCAYRGAVWTSSKPAVATVSKDGDGVVATLSEGTTTISATSYDGGFTDSFELTVDATAPSGYTVSFVDYDGNSNYLNKAEVTDHPELSFKINGAEVGSTLSYTVNRTYSTYNDFTCSFDVSTELYKSDSVTVNDTEQTVSIGTLEEGTKDGTFTLSVTLTDTVGNTGPAATDSIIVDTTPISYYYADIGFMSYGHSGAVACSQNADRVMTQWCGYCEFNAVFKYTLTSKAGGSPVSGSIAMTEENLIPPAKDFCFYIDMSALPDGNFDLAYSFTDAAGNENAVSTNTYFKDATIPTCNLSFGQAVINSSNQTAASFKLDNISETIMNECFYSISDGKNKNVGELNSYSGTYDSSSEVLISSLSAAKSGIDLSSLADGTLTLTVKIWDPYNNLKTLTPITIIKDTVAPTVTLPTVSTAATSIGLNFSETVTAFDGKTVTISDGTDTYTYTIDTTNYISGTGSSCTATIPLTAFKTVENKTLVLDSKKTFTVAVDAGAYKDTAGNEMAAASNLSLSFYTPPTSGGGTPSSDTGNTDKTTTNNGTVTASTTVQATTGSNGVASASVTESQIKNILAKAAEEANKQGADSTELEIKVNASPNATGVSATIPRSAFGSALSGGIDALTISSPAASISFNSAALSEIKANGTGDINISAVKVNVNELSQEDREKVGNRPVYDLTLTSGGTVISDFGGGTATVSVPYTPAAGEDPNKIVIYYISDSGEMITVPDCVYDASTGLVTFATKHFSKYAVGYNDVAFADVSGWSKEYVSYLAARGIINGTGDGTFGPESNITRAEFVTILAKLSGNDLSGYKASSFSDVAVTEWYFKYAQWAYESGISKGTDGRFNPDEYISRQDIAVMISRYAEKVAKFTLPVTNSTVAFTDGKEISAYASDAVSAMQRAGIISGNSDGSFAPIANATRAEAAKIISVLMQEMI